jgi:hypothetical protein
MGLNLPLCFSFLHLTPHSLLINISAVSLRNCLCTSHNRSFNATEIGECVWSGLSTCGCTALCWTRAAFLFLDHLHGRQDSLDGGSACRKTATCTNRTAQTRNKRTLTSMPQVGFELGVWAGEDSSCLKPRGWTRLPCLKKGQKEMYHDVLYRLVQDKIEELPKHARREVYIP